ncbi:Crp/Fnr family transcriptional regulator [Marinobacter caseinilyticus]|uniref:Crp/Fnr family transcriptional regulator n=1 Tax=Marinobacter caseinilyticus TaxID=2692195 RepID=UPI00140750A6|nr:Crp/Fnr family transcriptional regulator [Marinobacter caseinilyticus]
MIDSKAVLKNCPLFQAFPDRALEEAVAVARVRHFQADEPIYGKGTLQSTLSVIAEGTVRISSVNAAGREAVLVIFDAGAWFGDTVFSPGTPRVYGATAHEAATLVELPGEGFRQLMARYPEGYPVALDLVSRRLWSAMSLIEDDALRGIEARIGRRLLFLAQMHGDSISASLPVTFRLTREHIANMMGMTRQGVHKVLKHFESEGLMSFSYGRVTVPDPKRLTSYLQTLD